MTVGKPLIDPNNVKINGRAATVAYLDENGNPTTVAAATVLKVTYKDNGEENVLRKRAGSSAPLLGSGT